MTVRPQVPPEIVARLRAVCRALPETREEAAWAGTRWRVRDKTFAHVLMIAEGWPPAYAQAAGTDWDPLAELLKVSYRVLAPKTLVHALDGATR